MRRSIGLLLILRWSGHWNCIDFDDVKRALQNRPDEATGMGMVASTQA